MKIDVKQLAGECGATNSEGGQIDQIACFTLNELKEYTQKVIAQCANAIEQDNMHSGDEWCAAITAAMQTLYAAQITTEPK